MHTSFFLKWILIFWVAISMISCEPATHNDVDQLNISQQEDFKYRIIRYIADLPKYANEENKFDKRFDSIYRAKARAIQLKKYYVTEDSVIYFEVWKLAPSLLVKYHATGGKLKLDNETGKIIHYSEVYRTWKMETKDLENATAMIFPKMIKGEMLSAYYTDNANGKLIIEFPDKQVHYNDTLRKWVMRSTTN